MIINSDFLKSISSESYVNPKIEKRKIEGRGYGLFAKESIHKDEIVSISGGVIIHKKNANEIKEKYGDYSYDVEENFMITPLNPQDPSDDWRMNHCCEPNCGIRGQIVFVALKEISPNEELTFDYAMSETNPDYKVNLSCNKKTCRKVFTGNDWKQKDIQKKYDGYFSDYIQRKIQ